MLDIHNATVVTMTVYTQENQTIIDLDQFYFALKSVSCGNGKMVLQFNDLVIYLAAEIAWKWVNLLDSRSFVMVAHGPGCGDDRSRVPWVASHAEFDDKQQTVTLDAIQTEWKNVSYRYTLDFGEVQTKQPWSQDDNLNKRGAHSNDKRLFDVSLSKAFTLDLSAKFPSQIVNWNVSNADVDASLEITCDNCGTTGTLVFAGHIEASLFGGLETFEISATPHGIAANLALSLVFNGQIDFTGLPTQPTEEFTLVTLPLPSGWTVPGILTFGPNIQINAGYTINYIEGSATASAGISASIPDDSQAVVDLASKKPVTISGWIPQIQTQPLTVVAQLEAQAQVFTEIAVAVSLIVLGEYSQKFQ